MKLTFSMFYSLTHSGDRNISNIMSQISERQLLSEPKPNCTFGSLTVVRPLESRGSLALLILRYGYLHSTVPISLVTMCHTRPRCTANTKFRSKWSKIIKIERHSPVQNRTILRTQEAILLWVMFLVLFNFFLSKSYLLSYVTILFLYEVLFRQTFG